MWSKGACGRGTAPNQWERKSRVSSYTTVRARKGSSKDGVTSVKHRNIQEYLRATLNLNCQYKADYFSASLRDLRLPVISRARGQPTFFEVLNLSKPKHLHPIPILYLHAFPFTHTNRLHDDERGKLLTRLSVPPFSSPQQPSLLAQSCCFPSLKCDNSLT